MRIRALSVFEGVVYHCWPVDRSDPARPTLEVEARLLPGDADAEAGPLLLSVGDYIAMVGDLEVARRALAGLADEGRIDQHLGVDHVVFPTWTPVADGPDTAPPTEDEAPTEPPSLRVVRDDEA